MNNAYKTQLIFGVALLLALTGSYVLFTSYQPKDIKELREVKGVSSKDDNSMNLPYPPGAEKISISKTGGNEQITFESAQNKEEIRTFYKNVLLSKKWSLETEGNAEGFLLERYDRDGDKVTVTLIDESAENGTLVNISIVRD